MHEAHDVVDLLAGDEQAGVPGRHHHGLCLGRRGRARQPHHGLARHHHRGDPPITEVERPGEQLVRDLLDEPLVTRRAQHHGELVGRGRGRQLVTRLDAEEADDRAPRSR